MIAYHMNFSTRDMARIGYRMLRERTWDRQQLVPRGWARQTVRVVTPVHEMNPANNRKGPFGYGNLWWVWDGPAASGPFEGAYSGRGAIGQYITVLPKLDLVIAHKTRPGGGSISWGQHMELVDRLIAARCKV